MSGRNFDYKPALRGRMAKNALREMAHHATDLEKALHENDTLPAWVDYYIATSSDRMNVVGNYMQGAIRQFEASSKAQQNQVYGDAGDPLSQLSEAVEAYKKGPRQIPRDLMRIGLLAYIVGMPIAAVMAYNRTESVQKSAIAALGSLPYVLVTSLKK